MQYSTEIIIFFNFFEHEVLKYWIQSCMINTNSMTKNGKDLSC